MEPIGYSWSPIAELDPESRSHQAPSLNGLGTNSAAGHQLRRRHHPIALRLGRADGSGAPVPTPRRSNETKSRLEVCR